MIKFVEEPVKLSIIEKVCVSSKEESLVKKVLCEKWEIQAGKGKFFDCLQIAMYMKDTKLKARSTFAIASCYQHYADRKNFFNQSFKFWQELNDLPQ